MATSCLSELKLLRCSWSRFCSINELAWMQPKVPSKTGWLCAPLPPRTWLRLRTAAHDGGKGNDTSVVRVGGIKGGLENEPVLLRLDPSTRIRRALKPLTCCRLRSCFGTATLLIVEGWFNCCSLVMQPRQAAEICQLGLLVTQRHLKGNKC